MMELTKKIYVDIDSVLDTRFSLLFNLDKELLDSVYINNDYNNRIVDEFGYMPYSLFKTLYKYRSDKVLDISMFTNITDILIHEVGFMKHNAQLMLAEEYNIDVNTYPYTLTSVRKEELVKALTTMLPITGIRINIININMYNVNIKDIDTEYLSMIMYDGMDWLNYKINNNELITYNVPLLRLTLPALLSKPVKLRKVTDYESMFEDIEKQCSYFIKLQFTPISNFNLKKII